MEISHTFGFRVREKRTVEVKFMRYQIRYKYGHRISFILYAPYPPCHMHCLSIPQSLDYHCIAAD